jgi:hypothetical protein
MQMVMNVWTFVSGPGGAAVFMGLWLMSEALSYIPQVKANGVFQAVQNGLKFGYGKLFPGKPALPDMEQK